MEADREEGYEEWRALFAGFLPGRDIRWWNDPDVDPESVRYVFCFDPEPGRLGSFPNLQLICAASVGVERIVADPSWSRSIPLVRMGCEETAAQMADFVAWACLSAHRNLPRILKARETRTWDKFLPSTAVAGKRVSILGLGSLGAAAAAMLTSIGFATAGWSRSPKELSGVRSFAGEEELDTLLQQTDILVCLLPGTPETMGILNAERLAQLPAGASVINVARAGHVVLPDLIAALDSGHLASVFLDVFDREPLPADSPLWSHPKIVVTSHLASTASRRSRARYASDVITAFEWGDALPNRYKPEAGY
ncbi:glyoxylate/hydroxypyruvate reductase A [Hoeflea olei]|uniref:Glyoxylate/hydroxypyruvate reductase A n=1 Tax=Hoeflea olei TaxID=1480615 RepID=A0A1C1YRJ4_9HYPH|nr:glyoxylate/hydroxypyruvate reductase A [Hoeflea olei]